MAIIVERTWIEAAEEPTPWTTLTAIRWRGWFLFGLFCLYKRQLGEWVK